MAYLHDIHIQPGVPLYVSTACRHTQHHVPRLSAILSQQRRKWLLYRWTHAVSGPVIDRAVAYSELIDIVVDDFPPLLIVSGYNCPLPVAAPQLYPVANSCDRLVSRGQLQHRLGHMLEMLFLSTQVSGSGPTTLHGSYFELGPHSDRSAAHTASGARTHLAPTIGSARLRL